MDGLVAVILKAGARARLQYHAYALAELAKQLYDTAEGLHALKVCGEFEERVKAVRDMLERICAAR